MALTYRLAATCWFDIVYIKFLFNIRFCIVTHQQKPSLSAVEQSIGNMETCMRPNTHIGLGAPSAAMHTGLTWPCRTLPPYTHARTHILYHIIICLTLYDYQVGHQITSCPQKPINIISTDGTNGTTLKHSKSSATLMLINSIID